MAQNQYGARAQQQEVRQMSYNSGDMRHGWVERQQGFTQRGQEGDRPQARHDGSHNNTNLSEQNLRRGEQWEDANHMRSNQENAGGYKSPEDVRRAGRAYHYDERFHNPGRSRPQPGPRHPSGHAQHHGERHRPAAVNLEMRSRPRDRILAEPVSPKESGWDNPFPTFNTKRKEHRRVASLDKGLSRLDVDTARFGGQRPYPSPGREQEESRPHTSHGHHPPNSHSVQSPSLPQQMSMSPLRKDPLRDRGSDQFDQSLHQSDPLSGRPGPNPVHAQSPEVPLSQSFRNGANIHQSAILSRSTTMPEHMTDTRMRPYEPVPPVQQSTSINAPHSQSIEYEGGRYGEESANQHTGMPPAQRARSYETRQPPAPDYRRPRPQPMSPDGYSRPANQDRQMDSVGSKDLGTPDAPSFDVISPISQKNEEFHVQPRYQQYPQDHAAYQKRQYQGPGPYRLQLDTRRVQNADAPDSRGSPLSEFAFDLPSNISPVVPTGGPPSADPRKQAFFDRREQWVNNNTQNYTPAGAGFGETRRGPNEGARFPPRTASRQVGSPRSGSDAVQHSLPYRSEYQQTQDSGSGLWPDPSTGLGGRSQRHGQMSGRPDFPPNQDSGHGFYQPTNVRSLPTATPPQDDYAQFSQNPFDSEILGPRTSNSARPPPVRYYGPSTSSDHQGLNGFSPQTGPDALPAHPAPVRSGVANGNGTPQMYSRPDVPQQTQMNTSQRRDMSGRNPGSKAAVDGKRQEPTVSVSELKVLQQAVKSNPSDYATALTFAKRLVEAAAVLSSDGGRADAKTTAKNRERYIFDAHKTVKKLVSAGYPDAMFYLADCHGQGMLGLAPDPKEAFSLYQSAAKLNHPPSAYRVAVCCEMGQEEGGGTRRDPLKAIQWYKRAANLGDTPAMYKMGMILLKGLLGQTKSPRESLSWLKRAAERADAENPHALHELGLLYESAQPTDHVVRDEKYALQLFKQAGDLGYKYSQFRLGSAFEYGLLGCPIDARQSIAWYTRAASQAEHQSELALSGWYLTGSEGILQQSDTEAYLWARKAASSGLAKAEYAMGYFTEVGIGVSANLEDAKRWYYRAAAQNYLKARERLEELKRGGQKMQKRQVSRSAVGKQNEGECVVM